MAHNVPITVLTAATVANAATIFSSTYSSEYASGFSAVLVNLAGTSPSVTITQQTSIAGTTWHDPVNAAGSALGAVLTAGTGTAIGIYVQFSPVVAPYSRFKIVAAADSTVSITVVQSELGSGS